MPQTGFRAAKGKVVITMDADLQDRPAEIPELYKMIKEDGYYLVSGWKKKRHDPISKTIPSKFFNYITRKMSGIHLHDFNCGLKAYNSKFVTTQPFDGAKAAIGKKIHDTACEKCHSEGGSLAEDEAGMLAGQWMPYLKETFAQFTKGARPQAEKMKVKFNALKPEEQDALLHYYASQQ